MGIVYVCGIPGSGKTNYCEWVEREKGFLHLDFDQLLGGHGVPLKLALVGRFRENPEEFISELSKRRQPVVIDWGFPISCLPIVRLFQKKGIEIWWFDGDRAAACEAFAKRKTVSLVAFHAQMKSVQDNWSQIEEVVGHNVIETVTAGPVHAAPEWIFTQMFGTKH